MLLMVVTAWVVQGWAAWHCITVSPLLLWISCRFHYPTISHGFLVLLPGSGRAVALPSPLSCMPADSGITIYGF